MTRIGLISLILGSLQLFDATPSRAQTNAGSTNMVDTIGHEASRARVIGTIHARFADRKDIKGRYIRVQYDGAMVQLAGFVPDAETGDKARDIAEAVIGTNGVLTFWRIAPGIATHPDYNTYVQERATDLLLEAKVRAQLMTPDVQALLKDASVVAVDAYRGDVTIYLAVDAPPANIDLSEHFKGIKGLAHIRCLSVTTY